MLKTRLIILYISRIFIRLIVLFHHYFTAYIFGGNKCFFYINIHCSNEVVKVSPGVQVRTVFPQICPLTEFQLYIFYIKCVHAALIN